MTIQLGFSCRKKILFCQHQYHTFYVVTVISEKRDVCIFESMDFIKIQFLFKFLIDFPVSFVFNWELGTAVRINIMF